MTLLHELLSASASRAPERIAIEDPERNAEIDYRSLDRLSDGIRESLLRCGVAPGDRVGILAPKSVGTVAAIFGALKAGAAYVPTDPTAPASRNAYILRDCGTSALVVEEGLLADLEAEYGAPGLVRAESLAPLGEHASRLFLLTPGSGESTDAAPRPPDGLAYILYTSGSTGRPKGVMHTHASALSFVDWCSRIFEPSADDRFSSHAPFHFDLSILDLYLPVKHGAALILLGESLGQQPAPLARTIAERRITMWYSTPSILRLLVEFGRLDGLDFGALRVVNFAGEVFPIKHLRALKNVWDGPRYFNLYGPTETNVCTYFEVPSSIAENETEPCPIGHACSGDRCRVVVDGSDVAPGEEGELWVAGGSVMSGYWNLPENNANAFFTDREGIPWYKTGDVVRDAGDGCFEFLGRRDRMVKRRGYRVELGEIESALYRHPSITDAAVVAVPDDEAGVLIKAFINWTHDEPPTVIQLKSFCSGQLPKYMIPDRFSVQPSLPRTSTDKIDYQSLLGLET